MPSAGFEPVIPASERPQTHALDRAATGIVRLQYVVNYMYAGTKKTFNMRFNACGKSTHGAAILGHERGGTQSSVVVWPKN